MHWAHDLAKHLTTRLKAKPSTPLLHNQYRDECRHDAPGAAEIRFFNVINYVGTYRERPLILAVGEAPGPWGARISGVPFTSEAQLVDLEHPIPGSRTSTAQKPYAEQSASVVWSALGSDWDRVFLWNTCPYHPYPEGNEDGIRAPSILEQDTELLRQVVLAVAPVKILSVGRTAESTLQRMGYRSTYIRHPSHGGSTDFKTGIKREINGLR